MAESTNRDSMSLYTFGRLRGRKFLCYANASLQCLLSWLPFVKALSVDASENGGDEYLAACVVSRFRELRQSLMRRGEVIGFGDIEPFMQWVFQLSGVRLREGKVRYVTKNSSASFGR